MKFFPLIFITLFYSCSFKQYRSIPDLQLGKPNLSQNIKKTQLSKGLKYYEINRGDVTENDFFTLSTEVLSEKVEKNLADSLRKLGLNIIIAEAAELGPHKENLGRMVRIGNFKTPAEAQDYKKNMLRNNSHFQVRYTAEDGNETNGPFNISLIEIDLKKYKGNLQSTLGKNKVPGKELISSIANRNNARVAINAGFFAFNSEVGVDGDPAGISIIDGQLVSEATNGRSALILENSKLLKVSISHGLKNNFKINVGDSVLTIHGINREPGKILNCGNEISEKYSMPAVHDFVCKNENEIIAFNSMFGKMSPKGEGFEFIIDENGIVISTMKNRGGEIPEMGYLMQGTGIYFELLQNLVKENQTATVKLNINSKEGEIKLKNDLYAINGGPTLLSHGVEDNSFRLLEGFETQFENLKVTDNYLDKNDNLASNSAQLTNRNVFYNSWLVRRHPRTAIGITANNKVYMVVVYGRQPGESAGASITEMSKMMKALGCTEAFNLDGGGSSMMVIDGKKTGKSSDKSGEREVGDVIMVID